MSDFRHVVEIKVSPARIWPVLLDVEHWPEWTTSVTRVQRMDIGRLTLGCRTRIWQPKLMPAVWQVTSLDEKRHIFAWTTHTFGIEIVARHQVDAVGAHSRVILTLNYSGLFGAIIARLYRDLNWDYLAREANGLRTRCEAPVQAQRINTKVSASS
jgi:Polyketide cyclase / dehydrase and lipid transport